MQDGFFNDFGQDHIILGGIFELSGINKQMNLMGAGVKILIYFRESFYHYITYSCTIYTKYDLKFTLYLQPEIIKYNQSIVVNVFGKTYRTNFGDSKCKVDKGLYSHIYDVVGIIRKLLRSLKSLKKVVIILAEV